MKTLEIFCIGNELLIGKTLNTNENWIAARATSLGFNATRITTVSDDTHAIKAALREAFNRKPDFIVTTGGLGPTYDDKTLEGIAAAIDKPLVLNEIALRMVKTKYENYSRQQGLTMIQLTPERVKMAKLPEGAEPLPNPVGTAPGVLIRWKRKCLISLPGVPAEMKGIFEESVAPLMRKAAGNVSFYEDSIQVEGIMESSLAPVLEKAKRNNPHVYIKSHPKGQETMSCIEIHISTMTDDAENAKERLKNAMKEILELIGDGSTLKKSSSSD